MHTWGSVNKDAVLPVEPSTATVFDRQIASVEQGPCEFFLHGPSLSPELNMRIHTTVQETHHRGRPPLTQKLCSRSSHYRNCQKQLKQTESPYWIMNELRLGRPQTAISITGARLRACSHIHKWGFTGGRKRSKFQSAIIGCVLWEA